MSQDFQNHLRHSFMEWLKEGSPEVPFDIYARSLEDFPRLKEMVPSMVVVSAGGLGLFQAEGYLHDLPFYLRSEEGSATLKVASNTEDVHFKHLWISSVELPKSAQRELGEVGMWAFEEIAAELVRSLKPSPFLYEFEGWVLVDTPSGGLGVSKEKRETRYQWAFSPEEAVRLVHSPEDFWVEKLCISKEGLAHLFKLQELKLINSDDRVWPDVEFKVNDLS